MSTGRETSSAVVLGSMFPAILLPQAMCRRMRRNATKRAGTAATVVGNILNAPLRSQMPPFRTYTSMMEPATFSHIQALARLNHQPVQALSPIVIRRFSHQPYYGLLYRAVHPTEVDDFQVATLSIQTLRQHLLRPDCHTIHEYSNVLRQVRRDLIEADPSLDLPEPTPAELQRLIRDEFPVVCVGDQYPVSDSCSLQKRHASMPDWPQDLCMSGVGDESWAFVLSADTTKLHI